MPKATAIKSAPPEAASESTETASVPVPKKSTESKTQEVAQGVDPSVAEQLEALKAENARLQASLEQAGDFEARLARIEAMQSTGANPLGTGATPSDDDTADKVLVLYDPSSASGDRMTESYLYFSVTNTVPHVSKDSEGNEVKGTRDEQVPIALIPGLQEVPRDYVYQLEKASPSEAIKDLFRTGIVRNWSDEANFLQIARTNEVTALDAIAKCFSRPLLKKWASYWDSLGPKVRERLERREEELKVKSSRGEVKQVFGTTVG